MCDDYVESVFGNLYAPLLIEMEKDVSLESPCILDSNSKVNRGDHVDLYRIDQERDRVDTPLKVTDIKQHITFTSNYDTNFVEYGSPLIEVIDEKLTIIALGGTGLADEKTNDCKFYNIVWFKDELCDLAGICAMSTETTISKPLPSTTTKFKVITSEATKARKTTKIPTTSETSFSNSTVSEDMDSEESDEIFFMFRTEDSERSEETEEKTNVDLKKSEHSKSGRDENRNLEIWKLILLMKFFV